MTARTALRSATFRRWFGKSQVVDATGEPLVVYHGTQYDVSAFDPDMQGDTLGSGDIGFFFTNDPVEASAHATWDWDRKDPRPNVIPVLLSIQRPLLVDISNPFHQGDAPGVWYDTHGNRMAAYAIDSGYDGLIISDFGAGTGQPTTPYSGKQTLYVAFTSQQIKSAIGNSGAFDPVNPDLCDRGVMPRVQRKRQVLQADLEGPSP